MKYGKVEYMWNATASEWTDLLNVWPRENVERILFALGYSSGVLAGLQVQQNSVPNLEIRITKGVAIYRDDSTLKAKAIAVDVDTLLNLSSYRPLAGTTTVLIVASPKLETALPTQVTGPAPELAPGVPHPAYDAAFQINTFDRLEQDSYELAVVGSATGQQIVLAQVVLSSGMTAVLNSHISNEPRQHGSPREIIKALEQRIISLEENQSPLGSVTEWFADPINIPSGWMIADGRKLLQSAYTKLYSLIGLKFSTVGTGNPATDVSEGEFRLPRLTDRVSVAAGGGYSLGQTGGAESVTLSESQLPSHAHPLTMNSVPPHNHGGATGAGGAHGHDFIGNGTSPGPTAIPRLGAVTGADATVIAGYGVQPAPDHAHGVSADGGHMPSGTVGSTGQGQAHENRPPFFGAYKIMRVL